MTVVCSVFSNQEKVPDRNQETGVSFSHSSRGGVQTAANVNYVFAQFPFYFSQPKTDDLLYVDKGFMLADGWLWDYKTFNLPCYGFIKHGLAGYTAACFAEQIANWWLHSILGTLDKLDDRNWWHNWVYPPDLSRRGWRLFVQDECRVKSDWMGQFSTIKIFFTKIPQNT